MSLESQFEREEAILDEQLAAGQISPSEHRSAMRELQRDYRAAAREAAEDAYDREINRW